MSYLIEYTQNAKQDLLDIFAYISENLSAPEAAAKQINHIMDMIDRLDTMPFRYPLYKYEPWRSRGLRFIPVNNYIIFYQPREKDNKVYIVRIMYAEWDIQRQLAEDLLSD